MARPKPPHKRAVPAVLHDGTEEEWGRVKLSRLYTGVPEAGGVERIVRELAKDSAPAAGLGELLRRNGLVYQIRNVGAITAFSEIAAVVRDYRYQDEVTNKGPTPDAIATRLQGIGKLIDKLTKEVHEADWWSREEIEAAGIGWVELQSLTLAKKRLDDSITRAKRPRGGARRNHALRNLASRLALLTRELTEGRNSDWRSFVHVTLTEFRIAHPDPKRHAQAFDAMVHDEVHGLLAAPYQPTPTNPDERPKRGVLPPKPAEPARTGIGSLGAELMRAGGRRPKKGT